MSGENYRTIAQPNAVLAPIDRNKQPVARALSVILALLAMITMALGLSPAARADTTTINDNFFNNIMCGDDLGWYTMYTMYTPSADAQSKYNIQELYSSSLNWTVYNGTSSPSTATDFFPSSMTDGRDAVNAYIVSASDSVHSAAKCISNGSVSFIASLGLRMANGVLWLVSLFTSSAVNPNIICPTAEGGSRCINILKVLAGNGYAGGTTGIIGNLYSGLYLGLLTLAFAAVGIWMLYTGIIKHKTRTAWGGLLWALGIMLLGCMIGGNPMLVAQAPLRLGTGLGGCVIQAMNGVNCLSDGQQSTSTTKYSGKRTECYVEAAVSNWEEAMSLEAKQASCTIWRAFILQPWALGQFNRSYDELYYDGSDTASNNNTDILTNLPDDVKTTIQDDWSTVMVSLTPSSDDNPLTNCLNANDSSKSYRNIALYQLDLMSSLHSCYGAKENGFAPVASSDVNIDKHSTETIEDNRGVYADWYWMIELMSANRATAGTGNDDNSAVWTAWSGEDAANRYAVAVMAMACSVSAGIILISTSVLALMFMLLSILLLAFSPLFLLFGIVPGQGKRMFLGYVEIVVSNLLKYFTCILMLMVITEIYGAVLGTDISLALAFMFTLMFTVALWWSRKLLLDLFGRVQLGGEHAVHALEGMMLDKPRRVAVGMANRGMHKLNEWTNKKQKEKDEAEAAAREQRKQQLFIPSPMTALPRATQNPAASPAPVHPVRPARKASTVNNANNEHSVNSEHSEHTVNNVNSDNTARNANTANTAHNEHSEHTVNNERNVNPFATVNGDDDKRASDDARETVKPHEPTSIDRDIMNWDTLQLRDDVLNANNADLERARNANTANTDNTVSNEHSEREARKPHDNTGSDRDIMDWDTLQIREDRLTADNADLDTAHTVNNEHNEHTVNTEHTARNGNTVNNGDNVNNGNTVNNGDNAPTTKRSPRPRRRPRPRNHGDGNGRNR